MDENALGLEEESPCKDLQTRLMLRAYYFYSSSSSTIFSVTKGSWRPALQYFQ